MRGTTNVPSVYVLVRRDGQLAFVKRSNTGFMDGIYCLPAGHVEDMESFSAAAIREAVEEVGVTIQPEYLRFVHVMHRHQGDHVRVDVFFEADEWSGEPTNAEPEKHSEFTWFTADNLPYDKIMDYQAFALKHILRGQSYSELGW